MHATQSHWSDEVIFGTDGPQPRVLLEDDSIKMVIAGLEPQQRIPMHPERAAIYYFIEGSGWMAVGDERFDVGPGVIVRVPNEATRGMEAQTRLVFLGTLSK